MDDYILGYDCDGNIIEEFSLLRAMWSNDIDIEELKDADPRHYCAVVAEDGQAYAISVFHYWNRDLIREREHLQPEDDIPVIVKPISEMVNYELAHNYYYDPVYYSGRKELKQQLNSILKKNKEKIKTK